MLSHGELRVLMTYVVLVVAQLHRCIFVSVSSQVGALLAAFLHAFHLIAVDVLLLFVVHSHLTVHRSFLSFVSDHHVMLAAYLPIILLIISDPRRHLMMVRLMDHGIIV